MNNGKITNWIVIHIIRVNPNIVAKIMSILFFDNQDRKDDIGYSIYYDRHYSREDVVLK